MPVTSCPSCGATLESDPRFVTWCPACEWNLEPGASKEEPLTRRERRARERARRDGERLHEQLVRAPTLRPHRTPARLLAFVLAVLVHLTSIALVVAGIALILMAGGEWLVAVLGAFLVALGVSFRPRFGRLHNDAKVIRRADAPVLYETLDTIASRLSGPTPEVVLLSGIYNAAYGIVGFRRTRFLLLGMPLWWTLDAGERAALLGHELGHAVNGDVRRGFVIGTAIDSLARWERILAPSPFRHDTSWLNSVATFAYLPLYGIVWAAMRTLLRVSSADHQRARVSGRRAQLARHRPRHGDLLAWCHTTAPTTWRALQRAARAPDSPPLPEVVAGHRASLPAHELERLRRIAARRGQVVDADHPPTDLRIAFLNSRGDAVGPDAAVRVPEVVDEELAPFATRVEKIVRDELRHFSMA